MPSPIVTATAQACVLSATSNILAQAITSYRTNEPFHLDITSILRFVLFAILNSPLNFLWQQYLEESFPGYTPSTTKSTPIANGEKQKGEVGLPAKRKLHLRNTAIKFALDQTLGAWVNAVLFIACMGALNGLRGPQIMGAVKNDFWKLNTAGLKLWPLVSIISFTLVPVERRTVFGSIIGVGWGVYLSLVAASP